MTKYLNLENPLDHSTRNIQDEHQNMRQMQWRESYQGKRTLQPLLHCRVSRKCKKVKVNTGCAGKGGTKYEGIDDAFLTDAAGFAPAAFAAFASWLLRRDALFLLITPFLTALSMLETKLWAAAVAVALLPDSSAARTVLSWFLTADNARRLLRVRRSVWRARLAADFVLAIKVG